MTHELHTRCVDGEPVESRGRRIATRIMNEVYSRDQNGIVHSRPPESPATIHSLLAQAYFLYKDGGLDLKNAQAYTTIADTNTIYDGIPVYEPIVQTASPYETIAQTIFHLDKTYPAQAQEIRVKLESAQSIYLAGCIGPKSALMLAKYLHDNFNFKGTITVTDIAQEPLRLLDILYAEDVLGIKSSGITINTNVHDATCDYIQPATYDIVIADVLLRYLTDEQLQPAVRNLKQIRSDKGLLFIRDITRPKSISPTSNHIGSRKNEVEAQDFVDWVNKTFDTNYTIDDYSAMRQALFPFPKYLHQRSLTILQTIIDHALPMQPSTSFYVGGSHDALVTVVFGLESTPLLTTKQAISDLTSPGYTKPQA